MCQTLHFDRKDKDAENRYMYLAEAFTKNYISIAEVDLQTGCAAVLKSSADPELEGVRLPWEALVERYADRRTCPDDRDLVRALTLERLRADFESERGDSSLEVRCMSGKDEGKYDWVKISVFAVSKKVKKLFVATQEINQSRMMKHIVEKFVYQNFDYFILLDTKRNSYTMFGGKKNGTPLPDEVNSDYTAEMIRYNRMYVAPEDVERVTAGMQIPHILKMLETQDSYCISSGGIAKNGEYRRTRLRFTSYDRAAGLVLLTRADVTQIYAEERAKSERLAAALRDARHDSLTGLYNQKATRRLVTESLENQYRSRAAILFIDVDNFKMINDELGHQKGDELLCFLAALLQKIAGRRGVAGRIGGDEFLMFLPADAADVRQCADRICRAFASIPDERIKVLPVSCSVGIAVYPQDGTDYETLLYKADQALYTSKRYGKNKYGFYSESED